jgi:hypothetical protein
MDITFSITNFAALSTRSSSLSVSVYLSKGKDKTIALQAWTGPEGSGSLRLSRYSAHEGGKTVSLTHRPPLPQGNIPVTHFY